MQQDKWNKPDTRAVSTQDHLKDRLFVKPFHRLSHRILGVMMVVSFLVLALVFGQLFHTIKQNVDSGMSVLLEDYLVRVLADLPEDFEPIDLESISQNIGVHFALYRQGQIEYTSKTSPQTIWKTFATHRLHESQEWHSFSNRLAGKWAFERGQFFVIIPYPEFELWGHYAFNRKSESFKGGWVLFGITILFLLSFWVVSRLLRPIQTLQSQAQHFAKGELNSRVQVHGQSDLDQLSETFNQMAEQIENRLQRERALFGAMSHELRTPLARLRVAIAMVDTSLQPIMLRAVFRMEELIETLLLREKSNGQLTTESLANLNDQVPQWLKEDLSFSDEQLIVNISPELVIQTDRFALRLVIKNLVENALKYGQGKPVYLTIKQTNDATGFSLMVEDSGQGMSQTTLQHIFEPFFRADEVRNLQTSGTGLGLYLVQAFAHQLDGKIETESKLNQGTRVKINFDSP